MTILVIAEHDNTQLKPSTLNTVSAAARLGGDIHLLVAGHGCGAVADAAAKVQGVGKVLLSDDAHFEHALAEELSQLVTDLAGGYSHVLAPATTFGKNFMPRVAARLDVAQISDIVTVESDDTFVRPIYAGNAMATVQSRDSIKLITVRSTGFDPVASEGGSAQVETCAAIRRPGVDGFGTARTDQRQGGDIRGQGDGQRREFQPHRVGGRQAQCRHRRLQGGGGCGIRAQ